MQNSPCLEGRIKQRWTPHGAMDAIACKFPSCQWQRICLCYYIAKLFLINSKFFMLWFINSLCLIYLWTMRQDTQQIYICMGVCTSAMYGIQSLNSTPHFCLQYQYTGQLSKFNRKKLYRPKSNERAEQKQLKLKLQQK